MPGGARCPTWFSSVVRWSVSICLQWTSLEFILVAVPLHRWFYASGGDFMRVGLWTVCLKRIYSKSYEFNACLDPDNELVSELIDLDLYRALRVLTILSAIVTLLSAALSTIRFYRQQRRLVVLNWLEWSTYGMAVSSLVCVFVAMVLGDVVLHKVDVPNEYGVADNWDAGGGLILLNTAFALMVIAIPLHVITTVSYRRANSGTNEGMSGGEAAPGVLMDEQQAHAEGRATPRGRWASSSNSNSTGTGSITSTAASLPPASYASSFSHPSPYQPPNHYLPRPGQYHVSMGALPAAPVSMTPQW